MTTHAVTPDRIHLDPMNRVSAAARWLREAQAPRWEGGPGAKGRFLGYVVVSMAAATAAGLLGTAGFGAVIDLLASLAR